MRKALLAAVFVVCVAFGCAHGVIENGYDTISTANYTVTQTMEYLGAQHCAGKITDEQKDQAIKYYERYRIASDVADETLAIYSITKTDSAKSALLDALAQVSLRQAELVEIANMILNGGDK